MSSAQTAGPRSWTTKNLTWAVIGGAVLGGGLLYGAGFHWLGAWQTGEQVSRQLAVAACMESFLLQPDRGLIYAELKGNTSAYKRRQLLRKNKWASDNDIASLCDGQIQALDATLFEAPEPAPAAAVEGKQPA